MAETKPRKLGRRGSGGALYGPGHSRLAVSGLVLVNNAFAHRLIKLARGGAECALGSLGVTRTHGLTKFADGGSELGAHRLVAHPALLVLLVPLDLGLDICHASTLG